MMAYSLGVWSFPLGEKVMDITELQPKTLEQLRVVAREWDIPSYSRLKKDDLILRLMRANAEKQGLELRGGVLEVVEDGIGFLRAEHLMPGAEDIYVSQSQIRRFGLRTGDMVIGQLPEEVTDMDRSVEAEVIASTFDEPVTSHVRVAEMALERAKRLVEGGRHVAILLDSLTRLARAYNLVVNPSGRTLSGGLDPAALYPPKKFFGAARNIEEGGSLTIVATCLVDTGSRMDDVVYEEFKGTGNMELHLDRKMSEKRVFPSIDIQKSGTRREELLLDEATLKQVWTMRRMVGVLGGTEGLELMLARLAKTRDNSEFLATLTKDVM